MAHSLIFDNAIRQEISVEFIEFLPGEPWIPLGVCKIFFLRCHSANHTDPQVRWPIPHNSEGFACVKLCQALVRIVDWFNLVQLPNPAALQKFFFQKVLGLYVVCTVMLWCLGERRAAGTNGSTKGYPTM